EEPRSRLALTATAFAPIPPEAGDLSLTAKYTYQSFICFTQPAGINRTSADAPCDGSRPQSGPWAQQNPYSLLDLNLNWNHIMRSSFDASFFVQNVTNKFYLQSSNILGSVIRGDPRTYGLRVTYRFGASADH